MKPGDKDNAVLKNRRLAELPDQTAMGEEAPACTTPRRIENAGQPFRGWILYDGGCGLCSTLRDKWGGVVEPRGFRLAALQEPWVQERLGGQVPGELQVEAADGRVLGGVDAFVYIARFVWWAWPLWLLGQARIVRGMLRVAYRPIARHRQAISRACGLRPVIEGKKQCDSDTRVAQLAGDRRVRLVVATAKRRPPAVEDVRKDSGLKMENEVAAAREGGRDLDLLEGKWLD